MFSHRPGRVLGGLAAGLVFGWVVVRLAPAGLGESTAWPFGLVTGCALWCPLRGRVAVIGALAAALLTSYLVDGVGWDTALVACAAHTAGVATTVVVLDLPGRRRATLLAERDIMRYVAAAAVGGLVAMAVVWIRTLAAGDVMIRTVGGFGLQHAASELLLVPLFLCQHVHRGAAGLVERALQWGVTLGVTVLVFGSSHIDVGVFIVLTALSWGARRLGTWEALGQAIVVAVVATLLTLDGRGPFAIAGGGLRAGLARPDNFLLEAMVACVALVVVPLVLTVGFQEESLAGASAERDRITGIVDGARGLAIIGTDPRGRITLFNRGAERLLGYRAEEMLGLTTGLLHPDGAAPAPESLVDLVGPPRRVDLVRRDGEVRAFEGSVHAIRDSTGAATGFVSISEDVSDRLREHDALEAAVVRLQELDEAKDTFVSSISHELRTPLASIVGYVELLADGVYGPMSEPQLAALGRIETNGGRLLGLIDDLLTFARLADDAPIEQRPVELRQVVRSALEVIEPLLRSRRLELDFDVPGAPVDLTGDRALLERLLVNLVGNAVKFTPDGGRVAITLTEASGRARVEVADTGIGIPADEMAHLTSRFFRSRRAVGAAVPGTGLGLSIARSVVAAHRGRLAIDSVEGQGTTVTVVLPLGPGSVGGGNPDGTPEILAV